MTADETEKRRSDALLLAAADPARVREIADILTKTWAGRDRLDTLVHLGGDIGNLDGRIDRWDDVLFFSNWALGGMGALFGMGFFASLFESGPRTDDIGAAAVAFATVVGLILLGIEYEVRARRRADRRDRRLLDGLRSAILEASGAKETA